MAFVSLAERIDAFIKRMGDAVAWLTLGMVLVGVVVVVLRYVFSIGFTWLQELQTYMHSAVFLLGASYALRNNAHVRLDIVYAKLSHRRQALIELGGTSLFIIPLCVLILYQSFDYVVNSWRMLEASQHMRGLPAVFILKTFIWLFALTLILQSISHVIRNVRRLRESQAGQPDAKPQAGGKSL
ncbi:MAG: TRAP transporter small permease subunit [Gammaproteobacteria bacterium]|nr:TRAP transporter small permease subunit [Gammaproteobacteria bacterium]NIR82920.1 TRAP transporter small permease subunit [Gammaproteobacteria bacterium]NIR90189.1 TRAP transporter small permease subunit [Gammaproteobacteria bacterium]NIU04066.1 TRAP transporter small permease subunit [Gammaproteobacteria bacterium]NIV51055.1 TRAP transporter small permease subunit [Gammaproteobacteria bacterium]